MNERNYRKAIDRLSSNPNAWIRTKCWSMPKSLLIGYACRLLGEREKSLRAYESAKSLLEAEVKQWPDDPRFHSSLGIAYAALGRKEDAIQQGKKAVELLPVARDHFYGLPYVEDLAFIYTLTGETDAALDRLDYLLTIPSWITVAWLRMDPQWDLLRDQPGFKRLLEKHSTDIG
jgi:tetratricopeptide (TPR) repeat protein